MCLNVITDPIVTITAIGNQTVGDPLSLKCDVSVISNIVNSMNIIWRIDGTIVQMTRKDPIGNLVENQYTDYYNTTTLLQSFHNNTIYQCQAVIETNQDLYPSIPEINATDDFILIVEGKYVHTLFITIIFS